MSRSGRCDPVLAARHSGHHSGPRLSYPRHSHAAVFDARHHPDRLHRAVLSVRDAYRLGDAARHQPAPLTECARERRRLAADHALRAGAAPDAGDRRRLADAVRDLYSRARRHHPALCARHRNHQRGACRSQRAQLRLRGGACRDRAYAVTDGVFFVSGDACFAHTGLRSTRVAFVRVEGLRKLFGELVAVDGVSFTVEVGHTLALLGPSGCGKTTILRCIAGLEAGDAGAIEIAGAAVFDRAAGENVGFPLKVRRVPKAEIAARTGRILDMVGLTAAKDKPATALSGGQQQRVALARALVHEPRLVLFDEPMSNLDAQLRARMRMELAVLQERLCFTAIYVTHDQTEAFSLAETVVVMNHGRIETVGDPRSVFARPQTPFVAEFLGLNINRGRVVNALPRREGFHVEVALAGGFRIWGVQRGGKPASPGASVLACTRKEHIAVAKCSDGTALPRPDIVGVPDEQNFIGVTCAASFLGLEEEYVIAIDGIELGAIQPPCGLRAGEPVTVTIRPEEVIVFVAENRGDGG